MTIGFGFKQLRNVDTYMCIYIYIYIYILMHLFIYRKKHTTTIYSETAFGLGIMRYWSKAYLSDNLRT